MLHARKFCEPSSCRYAPSISGPRRSFAAFGLMACRGGKEYGGRNVISGGTSPVRSARTSKSIAVPASAGATIVALKIDIPTHACPAAGTPSTPRNGSSCQCADPSNSRSNSWKAFFAPIAMASFCPAIAATSSFREVESRNHDFTALKAPDWVQFALRVLIWMFAGLVS